MKRLLVLLSIITSITAFSQSIPKDANTIIVKGVTFKEAVNRLLDKGYYIAQSDSIYQTIKTEPKATKANGTVLVTLHVRMKDSNAYITGEYTIENTKDFGTMRVRNAGTNISPLKKAFICMNDFAVSLDKPIIYELTELAK